MSDKPISKSKHKRLVAQGAIVDFKEKARWVLKRNGYIPVDEYIRIFILGIKAGLEMAAEQDWEKSRTLVMTKDARIAYECSAREHLEAAEQIERNHGHRDPSERG